MITTEDLDDEEYAEARERFADLLARATQAGASLTRTSRGFVLVRGTSSWHTNDLNTIAHIINGKAT